MQSEEDQVIHWWSKITDRIRGEGNLDEAISPARAREGRGRRGGGIEIETKVAEDFTIAIPG